MLEGSPLFLVSQLQMSYKMIIVFSNENDWKVQNEPYNNLILDDSWGGTFLILTNITNGSYKIYILVTTSTKNCGGLG